MATKEVGWYVDEWHTWFLIDDPSFAERVVSIPEEMLSRYYKAKDEFALSRQEIDHYLMETKQLGEG